MKESLLDKRLMVADKGDYVEAGVLHFFSNGVEVAELSLVPIVNGKSAEVTSWATKDDEIIGHVKGNGSVHLASHASGLVYWVEGKYDVVDSAVYFPGSRVLAQEYHGFVPDWSDRSFRLAEDAQIVASTSVDPSVQSAERPGQQSWMMAPSPRDIAFRSNDTWWGVCIPGALPVGDTRFNIRRGRLSIEFSHYTASNAGSRLPKAYLVPDLRRPYDLLDVDVQLCRERKELAGRGKYHAWWARPIFCTWGEQSQIGDAWDPEKTPLTAANVRQWVATVREKTGVNDFTVVIDSPWFQKYGDFTADLHRFGSTDGLRALINDLHGAGHRVLLWFTPFKIDLDSDIALTEPDCLLLDAQGNRTLTDEHAGFRDYTSAVARNTLLNNLRYCLSPDAACLDADGLKIDFVHDNPHPGKCRPRNPRWGIGDEHWANLLRHLHEDAHRVKPDCLITTTGAMPYLARHTDMLRLNHLFDDDIDHWFRRARLGLRLMPDTMVDADGWLMNHARCAAYWMTAPVFAVPDLYHATRLDGQEPMQQADYRRLAAAWQVYENAPISPDMEIVVEPETNTFYRKYTKEPLAGHYAAISLERCCLATFSAACARVTASRDIQVTLPVHAMPKAVEAVHHDGRREPVQANTSSTEVSLAVPDAASDVKFIEIAF